MCQILRMVTIEIVCRVMGVRVAISCRYCTDFEVMLLFLVKSPKDVSENLLPELTIKHVNSNMALGVANNVIIWTSLMTVYCTLNFHYLVNWFKKERRNLWANLLSQSALTIWSWLYLVKIVLMYSCCITMLPVVRWLKDFHSSLEADICANICNYQCINSLFTYKRVWTF